MSKTKAPTNRARAIGYRIWAARRDHGYSQQGFADAVVQAATDEGEDLQLGRSAVAHWEAGRYEPALRYRRHIARVLDRDKRELFPNVSVDEAA